MIKNPKIGQKVWFVEDFTLRPKQMPITFVAEDKRYVYLDEARFFRVNNLYRTKTKAVNAEIDKITKQINSLLENYHKLMEHLEIEIQQPK